MKFFCFEIPSPDCTDVTIPMGVFIQSETQCRNSDPWSEHSLFSTDLEVSANFKLTATPQSLNTHRLLALKTSLLIGYSLKIHTHTHTHIYIYKLLNSMHLLSKHNTVLSFIYFSTTFFGHCIRLPSSRNTSM